MHGCLVYNSIYWNVTICTGMYWHVMVCNVVQYDVMQCICRCIRICICICKCLCIYTYTYICIYIYIQYYIYAPCAPEGFGRGFINCRCGIIYLVLFALVVAWQTNGMYMRCCNKQPDGLLMSHHLSSFTK